MDIVLGKLITGPQQRDAIHIAIAPVTAAEQLLPGQRIGFIEDSTDRVEGDAKTPIGIVDPFLTDVVRPEERFNMLLYQNTVTGMRHEWSHPAFPESVLDDRTKSEAWLRLYAEKQNSYDKPEEAFQRLLKSLKSRELFFYGSDLHGLYELDDADELKRHAECYLGIAINWSEFEFSCSC